MRPPRKASSPKRHERLEKAEQERHAENRRPLRTAQHDAADDGYREAVHGQGDGQQRQIYEVHHVAKVSF